MLQGFAHQWCNVLADIELCKCKNKCFLAFTQTYLPVYCGKIMKEDRNRVPYTGSTNFSACMKISLFIISVPYPMHV